ncbi:MAG: SpvB/TcaC N-terminal domain-containing protein [Chromatiales bacterium]
MANAAPSEVIALPKGGGALHGIGEKFSPDLHTGTGNFTVPIALPPGRNGFQPQLNLVYSTGNGNGPFGMGWSLSIPGVGRKTSQGIPAYDDSKDTFVLSGAEDLVPVERQGTATRYRPRTEGLFARILHHRDTGDDYWEVRSKDGLVSFYGTPRPDTAAQGCSDPAVIRDPDPLKRQHIFAWKLTLTTDPFGNRIEYLYEWDSVQTDGPHHWDQRYLSEIRYVDYGDPADPQFLVKVRFFYEDRPDPFSEYRSGFEIRTIRRCTRLEISTHPGTDLLTRTYHLIYLDQRVQAGEIAQEQLPPNGVSLLNRIRVVGHDGDRTEELPPLEFGYTRFEPDGRDFFPLQGMDLPARSLANPNLELADLFGNGLPDMLEMNGTVRYWRNLGNGRFDLPRPMQEAPAGLVLADPGVQLIDADGDGRIDLLTMTNGLSGYFPLRFGGLWDRRSFQRHRVVPSFNLQDPEVRLVDLDGDGVTDAIRSGSRLECFFNDPREGWNRTRWVERRDIDEFPNMNFSDPRVKWADMSGDGLQDIVLVYDGNIEYWPNLGYGSWGRRIHMENGPRFPYGYDPNRILVGDVDGDGLADLIYVDDTKVTLWINQSGNRWDDPITIQGTPPVSDRDAVRLTDMLGTGISGVLWSADAGGLSREHLFFLDFTGGVKPYLLNEMDNHMGAVTRVKYKPSTRFYLEDQQRPETRWQTPLPFPVHVVACVGVIDEISRGKLTTEYSYHHGYWDGAEREFRGFGRVDQRDTEVFEEYHGSGLHPDRPFEGVDIKAFSSPTETRTWFHQGPIGDEFGEWEETDFRYEFWPGDPQAFSRPPSMTAFLKGLPRRVKRDALRALRGSVLRTELYALDDTDRQDRPYTVTENLYGVREQSPPGSEEGDRLHIFFPHILAQRTTQWERGDDPMTQYTFTDDYDAFGQPRQQTAAALPRCAARRGVADEARILANHTWTEYAVPARNLYLHDRVAQVRSFELRSPPGVSETEPSDLIQVLAEQTNAAQAIHQQFRTRLDPWTPGQTLPAEVHLISHTVNHYDGTPEQAFIGRPAGEVGPYGALTHSESLAFTDVELDAAYGAQRPAYLGGTAVLPAGAPTGFGGNLGYRREQNAANGHHDGYYFDTQRRKFDFHDAESPQWRGLVIGAQDTLGHESAIRPDDYWLLHSEVTDPAGLTTSAVCDYRVLQPREVTDPNGNRTAYAFTPLGLLASTAVRGKASNNEGDQNRASVRMSYDFLAFENSPLDVRQPVYVRTRRYVHHDTETDVPLPERDETIEVVEYSDGFGRLLQTRTQAEDVLFDDPSLDNAIFGDAGLPADQASPPGNAVGTARSANDPPNVVVSGQQTYDNKGRVVEKYEPFFSPGWDYAPPTDSQLGQKAMMVYDPRGQIIRTVNPDGSEQRVIYGVPHDLADPERFMPTPWETYTYDANDNAGRTHPTAAHGYEHHWNTPASARVEALGRTIETVERNRARHDLGQPLRSIEEYHTRSTYDIQGNLLTVTDALGRVAFRHGYDLIKRPLRVDSIDAGTRRTMLDALGNPIEQRDSKGAILLRIYDILNRPILLWASEGSGQPLTLRERIEYGDGGSPNQPTTEREANRSANRLGKLYHHYDEAGLLTFESYDFKGNVLEKTRRIINDAQILSVFAGAAANNWQVPAFRVNWQPQTGTSLQDHVNHLLDVAEYRTSLTYDALNRIKGMRYPQDVDGERGMLLPHYNRAGALESVELDGETYVERIAYNAKGQRLLIAYGNGVMTRYAYDPKTFRLVRMRTERYFKPDALTYQPNGGLLQDFAYTYDLAGNILTITDRAPGSGFLNNPDALHVQASDSPLAHRLINGDALIRYFEYDPLYRLTRATGREANNIPNPRTWTDDLRHGYNSGNHGTPNQDNAPNLTTSYWESYAYDPAGNMVMLRHGNNGGAAWTRHFGIGGFTPQQWEQEWQMHLNAPGDWLNPSGNQLTHLDDNTTAFPPTHIYDVNGNLIRETTSRHFEWDHSDRMQVFRNQTAGAEPSMYTHYLYDASGQQMKKLVRSGANNYDITVYIDGLFEYHRRVRSSETRENNALHVMDDQSRVALVRVGTAPPNDGAPEAPVKYHLGDHLGSSSVVIGGWNAAASNFINREEYFPYGETSFGSFARKRYRFTGKERDEESGMSYHGARYFAPWAARWVSCDPAGIANNQSGQTGYIADLNLFTYAVNNPIKYHDPTGLQWKISGTQKEIDDFVNLVSRVSGVPLKVVSGEIQREVGPPAPPTMKGVSKAAQALVEDILKHVSGGGIFEIRAVSHASRPSEGVVIGELNRPTGSLSPVIDVGDIVKVEKLLPGHGAAFAFHELREKFEASKLPGISTGTAHSLASGTETQVLQDLGLLSPSGQRVARRDPLYPTSPTFKWAGRGNPFTTKVATQFWEFDYGDYYVELELRDVHSQVTGDIDSQIVAARKFSDAPSGMSPQLRQLRRNHYDVKQAHPAMFR